MRTVQQIPKNIEKLRKQAGLSQAELADKAGLSSAYISKLEEGKFKSMSLKNCKALADALDITLKDFLEGLGLLERAERPSFQMITQALRSSGYSPGQVKEVIRYAKYIKKAV